MWKFLLQILTLFVLFVSGQPGSHCLSWPLGLDYIFKLFLPQRYLIVAVLATIAFFHSRQDLLCLPILNIAILRRGKI